MATKTRSTPSWSSQVRKRDTGEQGNKGEFAVVSRGEADIPVRTPPPRARAIIGEDTRIASSAQLGEGVRIGDGTLIGEDVTVGAGASIGEGVVIRDGAQIGAGTSIEGDASIGVGASVGDMATLRQGVILQAGSVIGAGVVLDEEVSVGEGARLGRNVQVEQPTRIGAHVTIDESTAVGEDCVLQDRSMRATRKDAARKSVLITRNELRTARAVPLEEVSREIEARQPTVAPMNSAPLRWADRIRAVIARCEQADRERDRTCTRRLKRVPVQSADVARAYFALHAIGEYPTRNELVERLDIIEPAARRELTGRLQEVLDVARDLFADYQRSH